MKCHMIIISTYNGSQLTKYSTVTLWLLSCCIETGTTSVISRCIFFTLIQNNVSEAPLILWARHNLFVGQWPMDTRLFLEQAWNEILWLPDKRGRISKINGSTVVPENNVEMGFLGNHSSPNTAVWDDQCLNRGTITLPVSNRWHSTPVTYTKLQIPINLDNHAVEHARFV